MATNLKFYSDAELTTPLTSFNIAHLVSGVGDPQDFIFYLGATDTSVYQNNTNPGVAQLAVSIVNITGLWAAGVAKLVNNTARTTSKNGYRYKVSAITSGGLTGTVEPTWPITIGASVVDNQVTWINDGKLHEATEIKLASTNGGLAAATAGAVLNLGTSITGGSVNAKTVHMRIDDATAIIGTATELQLVVKDVTP